MIDGCCSGAGEPRDLAQLFAFGLLMSAGHCLGMCGPLVCAVSAPPDARREHDWRSLAPIGLYHSGRLASYALIGLVLGALGGLLPQPAHAVVWQGALSLLAAAALVWVGLGLLDVFPLASVPLVGRLSRWLTASLGGVQGARGGIRRFGLGMANGLLPCGPVYTIALAAIAAGGPARGALAMLAFGAGTVPLLAGLALGVRWMTRRLRLGLYRASAVLALLMGLQLALRGMAALEWIPHARVQEVVLW